MNRTIPLIAAAALVALIVPVVHASQPADASSPAEPAAAPNVEAGASSSTLFTPAPAGTLDNPFEGCEGTLESLTTLDDSEQACRDYCASNGWEYHDLLYLGRSTWVCLCCNTGG